MLTQLHHILLHRKRMSRWEKQQLDKEGNETYYL